MGLAVTSGASRNIHVNISCYLAAMFKRYVIGLAVFFLLWTSSGKAFAQAPVQLSQVRKVYIEKMDNNLDQYLASEISQKFHGSLTIVLERSQADAILKGVNITA